MRVFYLIVLSKKCGKIYATLFLLVLLMNRNLTAGVFDSVPNLSDSLKNKYQLSDPRNPHCPCHRFQKKAEREFKKYLNDEKTLYNKLNHSDSNNNYFYGGQKRRKYSKKVLQLKRLNKIRRPKHRLFFRKDVAAC